jgi:hypothetical protein
MPRYEHLRLVRLPEQMERRKSPGFGGGASRNAGQHRQKIESELDQAIQTQVSRRRPQAIDPSLILRVRLAGAVPQEEWDRVGLTVVSTDPDRTLVLFASNEEMETFRERLNAYSGPIPVGQKHPPHAGFFAAIEAIESVDPKDRIGPRLRNEGFIDPTDFPDEATTLDVELWDLGRRELRRQKLDEIKAYVEAMGGQVLDDYVGPSITMARVRASGPVIRALLSVEDIASVDLPPQPDLETAIAMDLDIGEVPDVEEIDPDAPIIGVVDSGLNDHPFLDDARVGSIAVPDAMGTADEYGHGTRVSGVAILGNLKDQLAGDVISRAARLCTARVVNAAGDFDDRRLVPTNMRDAITRLHDQFGCRLFVIALADRRRVYDGGKVGSWSATLDELARELDVLIIVAAGNRNPRSGNRVEEGVTGYPEYLTEPSNRLFEPAAAVNVVTVGSLAHGDGLDGDLGEYVGVRPIASSNEPSPFTRIGPGVDKSVKPEFVDLGGTMVMDPAVRALRDGQQVATCGVLTTHHLAQQRLITAGSGTSYAAPLVAFKASQLLRQFPNASANLLRALMGLSAEVPAEAINRLALFDKEQVRAVCGYGQIDTERASFSDDARVVLYAEDSLPIDHFAVYEIPIPDLYQMTRGRRHIRVSLAFDPPVRHTRLDYAGVGMSFRLVRGWQQESIFEHFRRRTQAEGRFPELPGKFNCDFDIGPQVRDKGTLQIGTKVFQQNITDYGDTYHLVVRCEGGWAAGIETNQRFAIVVELAHQAEIRLYERLRQRIRV